MGVGCTVLMVLIARDMFMVYGIAGESEWNKANIFTGWVDVKLSENGVAEAHRAAASLREAGMQFDCVFTSVLQRAIKTSWLVLEDLDQMYEGKKVYCI